MTATNIVDDFFSSKSETVQIIDDDSFEQKSHRELEMDKLAESAIMEVLKRLLIEEEET